MWRLNHNPLPPSPKRHTQNRWNNQNFKYFQLFQNKNRIRTTQNRNTTNNVYSYFSHVHFLLSFYVSTTGSIWEMSSHILYHLQIRWGEVQTYIFLWRRTCERLYIEYNNSDFGIWEKTSRTWKIWISNYTIVQHFRCSLNNF